MLPCAENADKGLVGRIRR